MKLVLAARVMKLFSCVKTIETKNKPNFAFKKNIVIQTKAIVF